jgi:hypothetical protein
VCKQVIFATLAVLIQIVCGFLVVLFAVGYVTLLGINMSWYSRTWLLFGLYGTPALSVALFISLMVSAMQQKSLNSTILVERIQFEGVKLNLTLAVTLCYMFGLRSNVMLLMWLAFAIGGRYFLDKVYRHKSMGELSVVSMSYPVDDVCVPSSSPRVLYCFLLVEAHKRSRILITLFP